jgi:hypothetical protein
MPCNFVYNHELQLYNYVTRATQKSQFLFYNFAIHVVNRYGL